MAPPDNTPVRMTGSGDDSTTQRDDVAFKDLEAATPAAAAAPAHQQQGGDRRPYDVDEDMVHDGNYYTDDDGVNVRLEADGEDLEEDGDNKMGGAKPKVVRIADLPPESALHKEIAQHQQDVSDMDDDDDEDDAVSNSTGAGDNDDEDGSDESSEDPKDGVKKTKKRGYKYDEATEAELKQVGMLKLASMLFLLGSAIVVCLSVAIGSSHWEDSSMTTDFEEAVHHIFTQLASSAVADLQNAAALSTSLTSYALLTQSTWPNMTDPHFEIHAGSVLNAAVGSHRLAFAPLVTEESKHMWEEYSVQNQDWITAPSLTVTAASRVRARERYLMRELQDNNSNSTVTNSTVASNETDSITPFIFKIIADQKTYDTSGTTFPYFPVWQHIPASVDIVNFNLVSTGNLTQSAVQHVLNTSTMVVSNVLNIPPAKPATTTAASTTTASSTMSPAQQEMRLILEYVLGLPIDTSKRSPTMSEAASVSDQAKAKVGSTDTLSLLLLPVHDSYDSETRQVVGVVVAPWQWSTLFVNGVSAASKTHDPAGGIMVVCSNDCGAKFSFQLDIHGNVKYLGAGDKHAKFYDEYVQTAKLSDLMRDVAGFTGTVDNVTFATDFCNMRFTAYPTPLFQSKVYTNQPVLFTGTVVLVFGVVIFLFLLYGGNLEYRLLSHIAKADHTRRLVNTLFPKGIQERMFKENLVEKDNLGAGGAGSSHANKAKGFKVEPDGQADDPLVKIKSFLNESKEDNDKSPPIADLFPHATVMFADIAGFTAWSSNREPVAVFTLLETVYKAFDKMTKKRKVFKVETIGDCYMCVTGLPDPHKEHASAMCQFATDCLRQMTLLQPELQRTLGPDTASLSIRVGLHSGPVTAGVLRGEKSRFQLFGDTVNTASRMESTGQPGRVQVSQTTADELIQGGKGHWIEPRAGGVEAKGKGLVQTFWLRSGVGSNRTGSVDSRHSSASNRTSSNGSEED